jgi:signal transduction histidine kinase
MTTELRDRLSLSLAALLILLGGGVLLFGRHDPGVRFAVSDDRVVISEVTEHSYARVYGMEPGMIVTELNGVTLLRLPQPIYRTLEPPPDWDWDREWEPEVIGIEPAEPTPVVIGLGALQDILARPLGGLSAIRPADLAVGSAVDGWATAHLWDDGRSGLAETGFGYFLGLVILLVGGTWLASRHAPAALRPLAVPLALAVAAPFLLRPLAATWSPIGVAAFGVLVPLALLPLADGLSRLVADEQDRRLVRLAYGVAAAGAILAGVAIAASQPGPEIYWWVVAAATTLIPGLAAAGPFASGGLLGADTSSGRLLQSTELAIAGATPGVALLTDRPPFPLALWLAAVLVAGRFTIRPLTRLVRRAQLQRDLVVAATEAERARVAADIHDDALQELTLLVRRLDAAGDTEGADIARTVSDRLRAICGDLRLPILDDLGVGPALDWLVLRIERLAGGEVRLERSDGTRPPPDVELAFFRVAQEALSNAVKHGAPPIVVRYRATDEGVSLSIDDAGPGIAPDAGSVAEGAGHFGLLNMAQRAEQIGAILDVRRWPGGGTHVALEWRRG